MVDLAELPSLQLKPTVTATHTGGVLALGLLLTDFQRAGPSGRFHRLRVGDRRGRLRRPAGVLTQPTT